jgi:hypothetical protein
MERCRLNHGVGVPRDEARLPLLCDTGLLYVFGPQHGFARHRTFATNLVELLVLRFLKLPNHTDNEGLKVHGLNNFNRLRVSA